MWEQPQVPLTAGQCGDRALAPPAVRDGTLHSAEASHSRRQPTVHPPPSPGSGQHAQGAGPAVAAKP